MKVVIFCGGLGVRMREVSEEIPKPMLRIGGRPILWHIMKYYAHYGFRDFILCLGYGGEMIREFFLGYNPYLTGDVTLGPGGKRSASNESDTRGSRATSASGPAPRRSTR